MTRSHSRNMAYMAGGVAVLIWATWPPDRVSLKESCGPAAGPPALSALLYPGPFWHAQLDAVISERDDLLAQPARRARLAEETERQSNSIEGRMTRLSRDIPSDIEEKERQEAARQSTRLRRLAWLMHCEDSIRRRLDEE